MGGQRLALTFGGFLVDYGVFDFDAVVFPEIWSSKTRTKTDFTSYVVWAISDHRPMWAQFDAP